MTFDMHGNPENHWNSDLKVQCNDLWLAEILQARHDYGGFEWQSSFPHTSSVGRRRLWQGFRRHGCCLVVKHVVLSRVYGRGLHWFGIWSKWQELSVMLLKRERERESLCVCVCVCVCVCARAHVCVSKHVCKYAEIQLFSLQHSRHSPQQGFFDSSTGSADHSQWATCTTHTHTHKHTHACTHACAHTHTHTHTHIHTHTFTHTFTHTHTHTHTRTHTFTHTHTHTHTCTHTCAHTHTHTTLPTNDRLLLMTNLCCPGR